MRTGVLLLAATVASLALIVFARFGWFFVCALWLAWLLLGFPIGVVEAVLLRSLSQTLANAAFVIPNGYGLQEDGGTLELEQGGSASLDPATVLTNNNNVGTPKNILPNPAAVTVIGGTCTRPTGSIFN